MRHESRIRPVGLPPPGRECFEMYTDGMRPWMAFFSIWSTCLGWRESVDREGYEIAKRLGKEIRWIETVEEQIDVLDGIPLERIVRQLEDVASWPRRAEEYARAYRDGDLEGLMGIMRTYDTRPREIVTPRDRIQFERIRDRLEERDLVAFVGFPHVPGIRRLFVESGARVTQGAEP
jgi:uncharacterized protein YbaP (TraB family)